MESAVQRSMRLLGALDDLVSQEAAALASGDFAAVQALQDRSAPVVAFLEAHASESAGDPAVGARVAAVHRRREHNAATLAAEIGRVRAEWQQAGAALRRVEKVAPAYGRSAATVSQLSAVG